MAAVSRSDLIDAVSISGRRREGNVTEIIPETRFSGGHSAGNGINGTDNYFTVPCASMLHTNQLPASALIPRALLGILSPLAHSRSDASHR